MVGKTGAHLEGKSDAPGRLIRFFDSVDADADALTRMVRLVPRRASSAQSFVQWLEPQVSGEQWSFITVRGENGDLHALALPTCGEDPSVMMLFPFVEVHSTLVAWWLTTAWRTRQLCSAGTALSDGLQTIAAAACARALAETAAQVWIDAQRLAASWSEIKQAGTPATDGDAFLRRSTLMRTLNEVMLGSKFDDRAPNLKATFGKVQRGNVLGSIEKLAKVIGVEFQENYQWLCNTVHPSLGNFYAFTSPPLLHDTGTHSVTVFHGWPIAISGGGETHSVRHIQEAVSRTLDQSAVVLLEVLDAALRLIDDVALTTKAPLMSTEPYWRNVEATDPQLACPCRSGKRGYRCPHHWGEATVEIPTVFSGSSH